MILEYTVTMTEKTHSNETVEEMSASLLAPVASQKNQTGSTPSINPIVAFTEWLRFQTEGKECHSMQASHYCCQEIQDIIPQTTGI